MPACLPVVLRSPLYPFCFMPATGLRTPLEFQAWPSCIRRRHAMSAAARHVLITDSFSACVMQCLERHREWTDSPEYIYVLSRSRLLHISKPGLPWRSSAVFLNNGAWAAFYPTFCVCMHAMPHVVIDVYVPRLCALVVICCLLGCLAFRLWGLGVRC